MLGLQEAVSTSLSIMKEAFRVPQDAEVELEEARRQDEPDQWVLTFSYPDALSLDEPEVGHFLAKVLRKRRAFKEIRIKALDGELLGVRNLHL